MSRLCEQQAAGAQDLEERRAEHWLHGIDQPLQRCIQGRRQRAKIESPTPEQIDPAKNMLHPRHV